MKVNKKLFFLLVLLVVAAGSLFSVSDARLLLHPDIHGDNIVFVYGGDLWRVSTRGGDAVRLTSHKGYEDNPLISPDGKWIAFDAAYEGNPDVYIIPLQGGIPRRLTYHPGFDFAVGWSPDGKRVVFNSMRKHKSYEARLYAVAVSGTPALPEPFPFPLAARGSYSPDGKYYAYNPVDDLMLIAFRRYRGGLQSFIWLYDFATHNVKKIPHADCNDIRPLWTGNEIFFLSDRDGVMNLYGYHFKTGILRQVTAYKDTDIKAFGMDEQRVVFEREGYLYLMDLQGGPARKLTVNIPGEMLGCRPSFVTPTGEQIYSGDLSPKGDRAVFGVRGEVVTIPAGKGEPYNVSETPGKMERQPVWSPDGNRIAYFGEENGEYALKLSDPNGKAADKVIPLENPSYFFDPVWSPDSQKVAFHDIKRNLYFVDIQTGKTVIFDKEPLPKKSPHFTWSPDSRWLAYSKGMANRFGAIYLYSLDQGKTFPVTDGLSSADFPVFDQGGKYLYFIASTDVAHDIDSLQMTALHHQPTGSLYLLVLSKDTPSPFATVAPGGGEKERQKKGTGKKNEKNEGNVASTVIDIAGMDQRILALKVPAGNYDTLAAGAAGQLYYLAKDSKAGTGALHMYNINAGAGQELVTGVAAFRVSAGGGKLLYKSVKGAWSIVDAGKKAGPGAGQLNTGGVEVYSDPALEYRQMLRETWRLARDYFYDPGMHGRDWQNIWKQYEAYLPHIASRTDLNHVMNRLLGEYSASHTRAGMVMFNFPEVPCGLLGADYQLVNGRYRIERIYRGENWNPQLRAPLTEPGIRVEEGEYILAVNGKPLTQEINIYSLFRKTAGKEVTLTINSKPVIEGAREITVRPVADEQSLRYRQWVADNREKVDRWSNGTVAYIHMPDTYYNGYSNFNRYFFAGLDRPGLILDGRFNEGGKVADYVLDMLTRKLVNYWKSRYGQTGVTPIGHFGAKVMLTNQFAGSGGDFMPWAFRQAGLGKIVGHTSAGALTGLMKMPPLMDGGNLIIPSFAIVDKNGEFVVENRGVVPDYIVELTPADFIAGKNPQLHKAVQVVMEEMKHKPLPQLKLNGSPADR